MKEYSLDENTTEVIKAGESNIETIDMEQESDVNAPETGKGGAGSLRFLYVAAMAVSVAAGTLTGLGCAVLAAAGSLTDVSGWPEEELHYAYGLNYGFIKGNGHVVADYISDNVWKVAVLGLVFTAAVIVLCVLTGRFSRDENGRVLTNRFDHVWTEFQLAVFAAACTGAVMSAVPVWKILPGTGWYSFYKPMATDDYLYGMRNDTAVTLSIMAMAACIAAAVVLFVSVAKKCKAHQILKTSLIGKLLAILGAGALFAGRGVASAGRRFAGSFRKLSVPGDTDRRAASKLIFGYSGTAVLLILLPWFAMILSGLWVGPHVLLAILISLVAAIVLIIRKVGRLAEIRAGVIEVKSGNLSHKITVNADANGPKTDLDKLASDINHISEATNAAVQSEIKNQRLKTDLISNVSHDLRTPLTSMISYLDILEKEGLDSPDAPAHLEIVREKTERLRTLTEELFEAAKASSGNIPCEIENIDLAALIDQSLAEMGDRLAKKELRIKKNIKAESTIVRADGKLLYRVFENLLGNISKYALDGSRVYIDVAELPAYARGSGGAGSVGADGNAGTASGSGRLKVEVKNISKEELNISADELMERFTRGDRSRNTDGSGLGLAIAKDLTTLMGGIFEISIDGDMFKASLLLDKAVEQKM